MIFYSEIYNKIHIHVPRAFYRYFLFLFSGAGYGGGARYGGRSGYESGSGHRGGIPFGKIIKGN